jgi:hypothetical protein
MCTIMELVTAGSFAAEPKRKLYFDVPLTSIGSLTRAHWMRTKRRVPTVGAGGSVNLAYMSGVVDTVTGPMLEVHDEGRVSGKSPTAPTRVENSITLSFLLGVTVTFMSREP